MILDANNMLALALDPALLLSAQGIEADPWQRELLLSADRQVLLNCSRQSGKSTTVAALALHTALFRAPSLILILSPGQRQSGELFRKVRDGYNAIGRPAGSIAENQSTLELANGSRIVCLPGKEGKVRCYSKVALLILDEASRVPDDLYRAVRPMLAVSAGRIVALSTPFGCRGWFFQEWNSELSTFRRTHITWRQCPRIAPAFIEEERLALGDNWIAQEYEGQFTAMEGLVYPDFGKCVWDAPGISCGRPVGGIDFGWRNPFAAVWGVHDRDDVLWIMGERYKRETPLHEHAKALKEKVDAVLGPARAKGHAVDWWWFADPAGATEIAELRAAGLTVRRADNDIRLGIAAVSARIRGGRLRISRLGCPYLIMESELYRYPSQGDAPGRGRPSSRGENPVDADNHALAALRYLVSKLDARFIARLRRMKAARGPLEEEALSAAEASEAATKAREAARETAKSVHGASLWDDEDLWETI